jgi:hypothetical protein
MLAREVLRVNERAGRTGRQLENRCGRLTSPDELGETAQLLHEIAALEQLPIELTSRLVIARLVPASHVMRYCTLLRNVGARHKAGHERIKFDRML